MHAFVGPNFDMIYYSIINQTMYKGEIKKRKTDEFLETRRELNPAFLTILDAGKGIYTGESARINLRYLAIKSLAYISGLHDNLYLLLLKEFENPEPNHRLYESVVKNGIIHSLECLSDPHNNNNCVLLLEGINCISFQRSIEFNEKQEKIETLNAVIFSHNVNIHESLMYDLAIYSMIHCLIADLLLLKVGKLTLMSDSFNLNTSVELPKILNLENEIFIPQIKVPRFLTGFFSVDDSINTDNPVETFCYITERITDLLGEIGYMRNVWGSNNAIRSWNQLEWNRAGNGTIQEYLNIFIEWIIKGVMKHEPEHLTENTVG